MEFVIYLFKGSMTFLTIAAVAFILYGFIKDFKENVLFLSAIILTLSVIVGVGYLVDMVLWKHEMWLLWEV